MTQWPSPPPGHQLRREAGGVLGERQLHPLGWDDLTGRPDIPSADGDPYLMERYARYSIDFMSNIIAAGKYEGGWETGVSGSGTLTIVDAINGIAELQGAASGAGGAYIFVDQGAGTLGSQDIARSPVYCARWAMQSEAGDERTYIGLCNGWAFAIPVTLPAGLYFDHVPGANMNAIASTGTATTVVDTGLNPVVGTFYRFRIVTFLDGLEVRYYYDDSTNRLVSNWQQVAAITTNLPASATRLQPGARHDRTSGAPATGTSRVDYIFGWQHRIP